LARLGQLAEARQTLDESLRQYETRDSASSQATAAVRERRARLLLDQDDLATAQAQFRQVIADAPTATWAHVALAQALRDQALAAARRTDAPGSPTLTQPGYLGL
jgi:tetratricopeptide (TPR) repeat protein